MEERSAPVVGIGSVLAGKYRVDAVLGSGGMGVVVAATHAHLHEKVAIKLLRPETARRPHSVERFLREARVAMRLRGEHVVRILDVGMLDDGAPYIVMEYLAGRDLGAVLRERGRLEPAVAVDYLLQVCEAIAEAHALGVVHRDLKPANLFLTTRVDGSRSVKVLDFGVSKIREDAARGEAPEAPAASSERGPPADIGLAATLEASEPGLTQSRALIGSPRYMAPEHLRSARDVDARADIWAMGVILFELLSGAAPFDGDSLDELERAVQEREPAPLVDVPEPLAAAVRRALSKAPSDRFPSALAFAEAIAPFGSEGAAAAAERIGRVVQALASQGPEVTRGGAAESVTSLDGSVGRTRAPPPLGSTRPAPSSARRAAWAAVVLATTCVAGAAWMARARRARVDVRTADAGAAAPCLSLADIRRLTLDNGCDEFPSLTPDGRVVVYDAVFDDDTHLVALDLETGRRRVLTSEPGWQIAPSVSPDGTRVAFLVMHGEQKGAYVMPLDGSAPPRFLHKGQSRPSWSPDGRAVWTGGSEGSERIDLETGGVTRRLQGLPSTLLSQTRELPDGRVFALLYDREVHAIRTIVRFDAGDDTPRPLYEADALEEAFALDPDGSRLYFTKALPTQHAELWQQPVDGSPASVADRTMEATRGLAFAGGKAAWSRCEAVQRVTTLTRAPDGGAMRVERTPETEWADERPAGIPSSASKMVVVSDRSAKKELWIVDVERKEDARRLDTGGLEATEPAVTADGRAVAFAVSGGGIYVLPLDPPGPPRRLTRGEEDAQPSFSKDGRTVLFETAGRGKGRAIAAVSVDGGEPKIVVPSGRRPFVSPADGRLAYVSYEGEDTGEPRWWDPRTGTSSRLSAAFPKGSYTTLRISPDGRRVALFAGTGEVVEVDAASGAVTGRFKTSDEFLGMTYLGDRIVVAALTFGGQIWGAKVGR